MEREYSREERFSISYGGSSAQVIRGEDLDPAVRRRKDAETQGADNRFVEMFCERYRDRGIAGRVHKDVAEQEKREALHRAEAPGTYVMTDTLTSRASYQHAQTRCYAMPWRASRANTRYPTPSHCSRSRHALVALCVVASYATSMPQSRATTSP